MAQRPAGAQGETGLRAETKPTQAEAGPERKGLGHFPFLKDIMFLSIKTDIKVLSRCFFYENMFRKIESKNVQSFCNFIQNCYIFSVKKSKRVFENKIAFSEKE